MYSSWFSYPVSRPYPFRWFTPVTIAGAIILTVAFTLINLASSAFYLKPIFTEDPNSTVTDAARWFTQAPFNWDSNLEPKCEPHMLSVGESFFTTNLGFQYTIKRISQGTDFRTMKSYASVPYQKNTLERCYLHKVQIHLVKSDTEPGPSWWLSWIRSGVSATAVCTFVSDIGSVILDLELVYSGRTDRVYDYVVDDNYTTHASNWWGSRLLNVYYAGILQIMSQSASRSDSPSSYWTTGALNYYGNKTYTKIHDLGYFDLEAWFLSSDGHRQLRDLHSVKSAYADPKYAQIISEGLHYTRILYSLVAVDLGNCQVPRLLQKNELPYAILPPDSLSRQSGGLINESLPGDYDERFRKIPSPRRKDGLVMLNETDQRFISQTGPLECRPVTVVAQYLCSIPKSIMETVELGGGRNAARLTAKNLSRLYESWGSALTDRDQTNQRFLSGD